MKILNGKTKEIVTFDSWPRPRSPEKHWKDGRSAKELARFFTSNNEEIPGEIKSILLKNGIFTGDDFEVYPEFLSRFEKGFGRGGGRQHDALMISKRNSLIVGIEAKADEPFDYEVDKWLKKSENGKNDNRKKRADAFAEAILGKEKSHEDILVLHYQLLSATIGTLLEAQRQSARNAMFLVLVLKKEGCYSEEKAAENYEAYKRYIDMLKIHKVDKFYKIPKFPDINFYIEYKEII